jgi:hypothetical protein
LGVNGEEVVVINELQELVDCGKLLVLIAFPLVLDNQALYHLVQRQHQLVNQVVEFLLYWLV